MTQVSAGGSGSTFTWLESLQGVQNQRSRAKLHASLNVHVAYVKLNQDAMCDSICHIWISHEHA